MNAQIKNKRVVFTMGGKGGVGKTGLMVALAEWFEAHEIPFTLLDLDTENKARGSLKHFFNGSVGQGEYSHASRPRRVRRSSRIRRGDHPRRHGSRFRASSE